MAITTKSSMSVNPSLLKVPVIAQPPKREQLGLKKTANDVARWNLQAAFLEPWHGVKNKTPQGNRPQHVAWPDAHATGFKSSRRLSRRTFDDAGQEDSQPNLTRQ
jgi:hypothetical protein